MRSFRQIAQSRVTLSVAWAAAVVGDLDPVHAVGEPDPNRRPGSAGVTGDVAQRSRTTAIVSGVMSSASMVVSSASTCSSG